MSVMSHKSISNVTGENPFREIASFSEWLREDVQTLTLAHTRKVQSVMHMHQTMQMQINEDVCIRN